MDEDILAELKRDIELEREELERKRKRRRELSVSYSKVWTEKNKEHRKQYSRKRYRKLKEEIIALKGGKCADCGGVFPTYAYDFHHLHGKDTRVTTLLTMRKARLLEELNKCILLCAICHRGRHVIDYDEAEEVDDVIS